MTTRPSSASCAMPPPRSTVGTAVGIRQHRHPHRGGTRRNLLRGLTRLDPGEEWLLEPRQIDGNPQLWSPGIRLGVKPDSWYRRTECFGPVLGLIRAATSTKPSASRTPRNSDSPAASTRSTTRDRPNGANSVEVGNAYINRPITGAIVRRQPFGGWKNSCFGPAPKPADRTTSPSSAPGKTALPATACHPPARPPPCSTNSVARLPDDADPSAPPPKSDAYWDKPENSIEHDPTGLRCESNHFRYRRFKNALLRATAATRRCPGWPACCSPPPPSAHRSGFRSMRPAPMARRARIFEVTVESADRSPPAFPPWPPPPASSARPHGDGAQASRHRRRPALGRWTGRSDNARVEWPAWLREQAVPNPPPLRQPLRSGAKQQDFQAGAPAGAQRDQIGTTFLQRLNNSVGRRGGHPQHRIGRGALAAGGESS
jgi:hypothetical protein